MVGTVFWLQLIKNDCLYLWYEFYEQCNNARCFKESQFFSWVNVEPNATLELIDFLVMFVRFEQTNLDDCRRYGRQQSRFIFTLITLTVYSKKLLRGFRPILEADLQRVLSSSNLKSGVSQKAVKDELRSGNWPCMTCFTLHWFSDALYSIQFTLWVKTISIGGN